MKENFLQFLDDPKQEERLETFCPLDDLEEFVVPLWLVLLAVAGMGVLLWFLLHMVASNACGV